MHTCTHTLSLSHTHRYTHLREHKYLVVKYILALEASKRNVEENEAHWGIVDAFPNHTPLQHRPKPQSLCVCPLSLFFSLFSFSPTSPHFDLATVFISHVTFVMSSAFLLTFVSLTFVSWPERTLLSLRGDCHMQTRAKQKTKKTEFHICGSHFLRNLPACFWPIPTKAPQVHTAIAVCELTIKKCTRKTYGTAKVSTLWSPVDARPYPFSLFTIACGYAIKY